MQRKQHRALLAEKQETDRMLAICQDQLTALKKTKPSKETSIVDTFKTLGRQFVAFYDPFSTFFKEEKIFEGPAPQPFQDESRWDVDYNTRKRAFQLALHSHIPSEYRRNELFIPSVSIFILWMLLFPDFVSVP